MTTVVLTPDFILADCRVTCKIDAIDALGKTVKLNCASDEFAKIGEWHMTSGDIECHGYVLFGDIEVAQAMVKYLKVVGLTDLQEKMDALGGFKIKLPQTLSGVAWVTEDKQMMWVTLDLQGYQINVAKEGTEYVALGSGALLVDQYYQRPKDIMSAFLYAAKEDPLSTHEVYDRWDHETANIVRHRIPGGEVPKVLEELLTGGL
ncbi:hypothetical protein D3C71_341750 [compost metagenome]